MLCYSTTKQEIMKINNQVNIDLYGHGLKQQKVYFVEDELILIVAENKRIRALATLDSCGYPTTQINSVLLSQFKIALKFQLEAALGLKIKTILKDYDNSTGCA